MKVSTLFLLSVAPLFLANGCVAVVGGAVGAAAGYEAYKAGYRVNITKEVQGRKPQTVKNQK